MRTFRFIGEPREDLDNTCSDECGLVCVCETDDFMDGADEAYDFATGK